MALSGFQAVCQHVQDAILGQLSAGNSPGDIVVNALNKAFPNAAFVSTGNQQLARNAFGESERAILEEAIRQLALRLVTQAMAAGHPLMTYSLPGSHGGALPRFLDAIKWLSEQTLVEPITVAPNQVLSRLADSSTYCRLLEDCLEVGTLADCQQIFAYMESAGVVEMMAKESGQTPARLCVLRSCNALLKRLSKSQDLTLCGQILIFIARIYSLGDKSGVNLHGAVNSSLVLPIDEVAPDDVDSSGEPVDAKLYTTFWGLQNVFKNPSQVLQMSMWAKTASDLNVVLDELDKRKITVKAGHSFSMATVGNASQADHPHSNGMLASPAGAGSRGSAAANGNVTHSHPSSSSQHMTVKYLSSSRLFGLQLRDAAFRRQFLVQCAALLHFVSKPGAKDRVPAGGKYEGLEELSNKVYTALAKTEDGGEEFAAAVRHVLSDETQWVNWKNGGCPPFDRPPAPPVDAAASAIPTGGAPGEGMGPGPATKRRRAGNRAAGTGAGTTAALLRQISVPRDQMADLKAVDRKLLPTLREFVEPIIEDMDPENCIEEEYRRLNNDKLLTWKVLRMMARTHQDHHSKIKASVDIKAEIERTLLDIFPDVKEKFELYKQAQAAQQAQETAAASEADGGGAGEGGGDGEPQQSGGGQPAKVKQEQEEVAAT